MLEWHFIATRSTLCANATAAILVSLGGASVRLELPATNASSGDGQGFPLKRERKGGGMALTEELPIGQSGLHRLQGAEGGPLEGRGDDVALRGDAQGLQGAAPKDVGLPSTRPLHLQALEVLHLHRQHRHQLPHCRRTSHRSHFPSLSLSVSAASCHLPWQTFCNFGGLFGAGPPRSLAKLHFS